MHEYEIAILNLLKRQGSADLEYLQDSLKMGRDSAMWAIENLSRQDFVKVERESSKTPHLTAEGKRYLNLFPEEELIATLSKKGGIEPLSSTKNEIGLIWAKRNGWITIDNGKILLSAPGKEMASGKKTYIYKELLNTLAKSQEVPDQVFVKNKNEIDNLKKRNLLEITEHGAIKKIEITEKGMRANQPTSAGAQAEASSMQGALTRELITSGRWKKEIFRSYDINAPSEEPYPARLHPMHEFVDIVRKSWFNMGFMEVSGPIIESAFWNFDALFSPQDHPTRDMQDTFFLKNPPKISIDDIALMNRVKSMHVENWKEAWKEDVAQQALLRTQTTSVSARYINKLANISDANYPLKLFSVGKVFRNESIDYKHLAELYMTDGIVIGNNLTFSNLISTLKLFYSQLGMDKLIIRPAYFPFVEPGLEIHYYDEKRKETIELCGGGIIRKEITKAMGTNKTVLAWGGGLERLMFKALGINSLTELYKNEVGWLRKRPELKI